MPGRRSDCMTCAIRTPRSCWPTAEPIKVVSERLGHASATITLGVYSHVLPVDEKRARQPVRRPDRKGMSRAQVSAKYHGPDLILPIGLSPAETVVSEGGLERSRAGGHPRTSACMESVLTWLNGCQSASRETLADT